MSNIDALSGLLGESVRRIQLLASEGIIPKATRSGYDVIACTRGFIQYLKDNKDICNAEELADFFGATTAAIYKWQKQGMPRIKRGKYSKKDCANWLINKWRARAEGTERAELDDERRELVRHQKRKAKVEADTMERTAIPFEEVRVDFEKIGGMVVSEIMALPGRMAGELAALTDPGEVRQKLATETRLLRRRIADAAGKYEAGID